MKTKEQTILFTDQMYLTDGGLETTLIFHEGVELPHFAAFELLRYPEGRTILERYYQKYIRVAEEYGLDFILETPTWRANPDWGFKLGYSPGELDEVNRLGVQFMKRLADTISTAHKKTRYIISGNIGPRGDGYSASDIMTPREAREYHHRQVHVFAKAKADLVTAMTINYCDEAVGIAEAAKEIGIPVVISFTVETDGRLPDGELLKDAIEKTDRLTENYVTHYMINCAHPEHFKHLFLEYGDWMKRIRGIRANASTRSHAELDEADTLDTGNKEQLAKGYSKVKDLLPHLAIVGGCCGTDHTHIREVCRLFHAHTPNR